MSEPVPSIANEGSPPVVGPLVWLLAPFAATAVLAVASVLLLASGQPVVGAVAGISVLALAAMIWRSGDRPVHIERGLPITPTGQPGLVAFVAEVASGIGVERPGSLEMVDGVDLYLVQETSMWGLRRAETRLGLGVALVSMMTRDELAAMVTSELARSHRGGSPLRRLAARAHYAAFNAAAAPSPSGLARAGLAYRRRVADRARPAAVAALHHGDRLAAERFGRTCVVGGLQRIHMGAAAYEVFVREYVTPMWATGHFPVDLYEGLRSFGASAGREQLFESLHLSSTEIERSGEQLARIADRIERVERLPGDDRPVSAEPASGLLTRRPELERRVSELVVSAVVGEHPVESTWAHYGEIIADVELAWASRLAAAAQTAAPADRRGGGLSSIVRLAGSSERHHLATVVAPELSEFDEYERNQLEPALLASYLRAAIGSALVDHAGCHWAIDWEGPARIVGPDGPDIDLEEWIVGILETDVGASSAIEWLAHVGVPVEAGV